MNIIERLDAWIVRRIYQPLVDFSGLTPAWWVRCMGILILCAEAARLAVGYRPEGWALAIWCVHVLLTAAVPVSFPGWAIQTLRIHNFARLFGVTISGFFVAAVGVILLLVAAVVGTSVIEQRVVFRFVADVAVLSVLFFAVCKDPPPPRRAPKPSLATARGSA